MYVCMYVNAHIHKLQILHVCLNRKKNCTHTHTHTQTQRGHVGIYACNDNSSRSSGTSTVRNWKRTHTHTRIHTQGSSSCFVCANLRTDYVHEMRNAHNKYIFFESIFLSLSLSYTQIFL